MLQNSLFYKLDKSVSLRKHFEQSSFFGFQSKDGIGDSALRAGSKSQRLTTIITVRYLGMNRFWL